ncbi:hypothetical protein PIIN_08569 [Serendipita indica DSM 11827]|uniref:Dynamin N-terminal domain-containing protein n=1 Tax=Serendipita indica (strain DSM 11827) TaxID=1109443 RepID=G4TTH4_SERID|nr:hypothetical protein PIIN_08569 [Serendipita indica DSM 11827]
MNHDLLPCHDDDLTASVVELYRRLTNDIRFHQRDRFSSIPVDYAVVLMESLQTLVTAILRDENYLTFATATNLDAFWGLPGVAEAVAALRQDLNDAIRLISNEDRIPTLVLSLKGMAPVRDNPVVEKTIQRSLDELTDEIKVRRDAIIQSSSHLRKMYESFALTKETIGEKSLADYKILRSLVTHLFGIDPLSVTKASFNFPSKIRTLNSPTLGSAFNIPFTEYNPCFNDIEESSKVWTRRQLAIGNQTSERPLDRLVEQFLSSLDITIKSIANLEGGLAPWDDGDIIGMLSRSCKNLDKKVKEIESASSVSTTIAICGQMKAGKSTFLNALIGRNLLTSRKMGCTTWPVIVRNNPKALEPTLTVETPAFDPFLQYLRGSLDDNGAPTTTDVVANKVNRSRVFWNKMGSHLKTQYAVFRSKNFALKRISSTLDDIVGTVEYFYISDINDLLRLYWNLEVGRERLVTIGRAFPVLEVRFDVADTFLHDVEFVDMPGLADAGIDESDRMDIYQEVFKISQGVIYVVEANYKAIGLETKEAEARGLIRLANKRPLFVVATHSETVPQDFPNSEEGLQFAHTMMPNVRISRVMSRCHFCTPVYKLASLALSRIIEQCKRNATSIPDWDQIQKNPTIEAGLNAYFLNRGSKMWTGNLSEIARNTEESMRQESKMPEVSGYIKKCILDEIVDGKRMDSLGSMFSALRESVVGQQILLDQARLSEIQLQDAKAERDDYLAKSHKIFASWDHNRLSFSAKSYSALKRNLDFAFEKAEKAVEKAVKDVSAKYPVVGNIILFMDRTQALSFLVDVANNLRARLSVILSEAVLDVREVAHKAWEERISGLASQFQTMLPDGHGALQAALKADLIFTLDDLSSSRIDEALGRMVADRASADQPWSWVRDLIASFSPWIARAFTTREADIKLQAELLRRSRSPAGDGDTKAEEERKKDQTVLEAISSHTVQEIIDMEKIREKEEQDRGQLVVQQISGLTISDPSFAQKHARGEANFGDILETNGTQNPPKELAEISLQDLFTESEKWLGWLVVAPNATGYAETPATATIWPCLAADVDPQLDIATTIATYKQYTLRTWQILVTQQAKDGLDRAITLSSAMGLAKVQKAFSKQQQLLDSLVQQLAAPVNPDMEVELLVTQMRSISTLAVLEELHAKFKELWEYRYDLPQQDSR